MHHTQSPFVRSLARSLARQFTAHGSPLGREGVAGAPPSRACTVASPHICCLTSTRSPTHISRVSVRVILRGGGRALLTWVALVAWAALRSATVGAPPAGIGIRPSAVSPQGRTESGFRQDVAVDTDWATVIRSSSRETPSTPPSAASQPLSNSLAAHGTPWGQRRDVKCATLIQARHTHPSAPHSTTAHPLANSHLTAHRWGGRGHKGREHKGLHHNHRSIARSLAR